MTQQAQVRRDTIKTVNFRGKLIDTEQGTIVHHDIKPDTLGSYIDENNHMNYVVVSNGDTFAVQMYVPRHIDTQQLKSDLAVLRLMERIESVKPCDSSLLAHNASTSSHIAIKHPKHVAIEAKHRLDADAVSIVFLLTLPLCTLLMIKSALAWVDMLGKIRAVWNA